MTMKKLARFKIRTHNPIKIINLFRKFGIELFDIDVNNATLTISVSYENQKKACELLDELFVKYKLCYSPLSTANKVKQNTFIIVGIIVGLVICIYLTFMIMQIEVQYVGEGVEQEQVYETLRQNGIEKGKLRININAKQVVEQLNKLSNVAYASVSNKGVVITVIIVCELQHEELIKISENTLFAKKNATISYINVDSGATNLKIGDTVKKGEPVIYNYRYNKENLPVFCYAKGEAYGKVSYNASEKIYDKNGIPCSAEEVNQVILKLKERLFSEMFFENPLNIIQNFYCAVKHIDNYCLVVIYYTLEESII